MKMLLVCAVLLFSACDIKGSAEITFVNNSEHNVEKIWGASDGIRLLLKPGETVTRAIYWDEHPPALGLLFYINGKVYGTIISNEEREEAGEAESYRFQSDMWLDAGDHITITVSNEYYWTIRRN